MINDYSDVLEKIRRGESIDKLEVVELTFDQYENLLAILEENKSLQFLSFSHSTLREDFMLKLGQAVGKHTQLLKLIFDNCVFAAEDGTKVLAEGLTTNRSLKSFTLMFVATDGDTANLLQALASPGNNIRRLTLHGCILGPESIKALTNFMKTSTELEFVSLEESNTDEGDFSELVQAIESNKNLQIQWNLEDFGIDGDLNELQQVFERINTERKAQNALTKSVGAFSQKTSVNTRIKVEVEAGPSVRYTIDY